MEGHACGAPWSARVVSSPEPVILSGTPRRILLRNPMPDPSPSTAQDDKQVRVIVIGGGLAGMAAAVALESAGMNVTLLEARKSLGGRAGSFEDPQTGELLDNCQHALLGCCTNLIDFYKRIGASDRIHWHRAIHFRDDRGRRHDLWGMPGLPAPLHLAASLVK